MGSGASGLGTASGMFAGGAAGDGSTALMSGGSGGADWAVGNQGLGPAMVAGGAAGDYSTSIGGELGGMSSGALADQTAGLAPSMGSMGKYASAAGGAITAGVGIYSAYENSNPLSGAIAGAMGGAEIGSLFGPAGMAIGAVVGGIAGALAGVFGDQGKGKARDYDTNTVQPAIAKDLQDYEAGRTGYGAASKAISDLLMSAQSQTAQWGSGARSWFSDHIQPEVAIVTTALQKQERGGRSAVTMSAAQYHTGGWVGDFGDFGTGDNEGFAKLLRDEFVVQPMAARAHSPLLSAINAGNVSYASTVQPRMPASAGSGATVNLTIKAIDSQSVAQWAKAGGGRDLVAAINQAQRQYSGVGRG